MKKVIIADDEKLSREVLRYLISHFNIPFDIVGEASDGDEALTLISIHTPDIVFIDIRMPGYNGLEVIEQTKKLCGDNIKFIVITAYSYFEYAQSALRLGVKDILLKPVDPDEFIKTIQRVFEYKYTDNNIFNDILEYINKNYSIDITLHDIAGIFHTNMYVVTRMFKKYLGVSFTAHINNLRVKTAQELLNTTDLSIKEIAGTVGYNNLNYFYKSFKKCTCTTPSVYKKTQNQVL